MRDDTKLAPGDPSLKGLINPTLPTSSMEFVNLFVHFYRGEMGRVLSWRDRVDRTTNWAITVVAAMLSVSLTTPSTHHSVLIFAMLVLTLLLAIETRRYRFFDFYRNRLRRLERNYYAAVFAPELGISADWGQELAKELIQPLFSIGYGEAMSRRLRRNYVWIFLILLCAWTLKMSYAPIQPNNGRLEFVQSAGEWLANGKSGPLPGWLVVSAIGLFYCWLIYATLRYRSSSGEMAYGEVHV
jgi:uncharacterized membrane protein